MNSKFDPQKREVKTPRANKGEAIRDITKGRICSSCNIYKDRWYFFDHPLGFNGLGSRCKECVSLFNKTDESKKIKKGLYDKRKNSNECVRCGNLELVTNIHCEKHWFECEANSCADGMKNLDAILKLWQQQQGRCFYTGEVLIPGLNASLDHQLPRSRGGLDDPSNLKWVSKNINFMKSIMTHDEFINMCSLIYSRFR